MRISKGDAVSPAGDVDVSAEDAHLPREKLYLLWEVCSHLQISGCVALLVDIEFFLTIRRFLLLVK